MSEDDREAIASQSRPVKLLRGQTLETPSRRLDIAYFVESGLVATVAQSQGREVGVGVVGNDGMVSIGILLHAEHPTNETRVQSDGAARAIGAEELHRLMETRPLLRSVLLQFVQVCLTQSSQNALCNSLASMQEKLARWILMSHDRSDGQDIHVTHDFIALMLGVRRQGVTVAMHELEGKGLLKSTRENIHVLNRAGLIREARSFYGVCEDEYNRLITPVAELWPHVFAAQGAEALA